MTQTDLEHAVKVSETWYEATAARQAPRAPLRSRVAADVCVIGGGLAGLTLTRELQRRGRSVVLLEARRIAWGASGRNGGSVSSGFSEGIEAIASRHGLSVARELFRLSALGTDYIGREIATHDPSIKMGDGSIVARRVPDRDGTLRHAEAMARDYGRNLDFLGREELRLLLRSERYFLGLRDNAAFHIHPLRYALMLLGLAEVDGARVYENSRAVAVAKTGAGFSVRTSEGEVTAQHVVHCVSALDRRIHAATGKAVLPIATYIIATERLQQDSIITRSFISDTRRSGDYYRQSNDGRILWGGRITTRQSAPLRLGQLLRGDMVSVFPQLGDPLIDFAWAGLMGYAPHKMPLIGRDADGQWYATAFGGHGLNTTAMAGNLLARAIADGDDEYRRFGIFTPRWAGGLLGRAGVQGSYWWMQLRDRVDESKALKTGNVHAG